MSTHCWKLTRVQFDCVLQNGKTVENNIRERIIFENYVTTCPHPMGTFPNYFGILQYLRNEKRCQHTIPLLDTHTHTTTVPCLAKVNIDFNGRPSSQVKHTPSQACDIYNIHLTVLYSQERQTHSSHILYLPAFTVRFFHEYIYVSSCATSSQLIWWLTWVNHFQGLLPIHLFYVVNTEWVSSKLLRARLAHSMINIYSE